jgi:hypothetical protein
MGRNAAGRRSAARLRSALGGQRISGETPLLLELLFGPAGGLPIAFLVLLALWTWLGPD